MAGIVALRGVDSSSSCGCGMRGFGADAGASATANRPSMSATTVLLWIAALGTVGYIFWGTLQPKSRRLVT